MLMTKRNLWIATAALTAALASTSSRSAFADGKNEVRAVTFDEDGAVTRIHVRGATTPTFTAYKLERPSRIVIDMPQAQLAELLRAHDNAAATLTPGTWAVSNIAAQQLDDGGAIVRVSITLARPGRYDVKTDGNEVLILVTARDPAPKTASPEQLAAAQAQAHAADEAASKSRAEAATAKQQAATAQADAERLRKAALDQTQRAEAAQRAADDAKKQSSQASKVEIERAKAEAARAQDEAAKAKLAASAAQVQADRARDAAEHAKTDAVADAERARAQTALAQRDAAVAKDDAAAAKSAAARTKVEADQAKATAAQAQSQVAVAKDQAAAAQLDADRARTEAARTKAEAEAAKADAAKARGEAEQAKADAAKTRTEADLARTAAAADKRQAEADKRAAEATRGEAERTMQGAKQQLASLDKKIATAQELEDKARSAHAAAQAREEAARDAELQANKDRIAAEDAAKRAAEARDRSSSQAKSEREKLIADARAAEDRLARAKAATEQAEAQRTAAETAVGSAKHDLETTRGALASVEQQRTSAESAASEAARKRSEAEAAASDATRRRTEAETAAMVAGKKRSEAEAAATSATRARGEAEAQRVIAEHQRVTAEDAAKTASAARDAADKQRQIAETAASKAQAMKAQAEGSLAELTDRRVAAEKAATEVEARTKASAKAQAELAAAQAHQASETEVAAAKAVVAKLATERKQAETELADRRKAVASQQAESQRLRTAAGEARDAADREETRRARLADQRQTEEKELARIKQQKADAVAPAPVLAAAPTGKPAKISAIKFEGDDVNGRIDIALGGDAHVELGAVTATTVELLIDNAELAAKLERKLDTSRFGGPVRSVSSFRDRHAANRVRLVAELASPATPSLTRDGSGAHWQLVAAPVVTKASPSPAAAPRRAAHTTDMPATVVGGFGAASTPVAQQSVAQLPPQGSRRRIYHGATVDFDFKDAPMADLLRIIADTGHISIVVPDEITARVTVRLKRVPWDQALEVILSSHGLWYRHEGNIYRVAPRKELDAEDEAENARRAAMVQAEAPRPEVITLNYASAAELKAKLVPMLSPKGKLEVEERTNALIINDVAGNREQIIRLALGLDTQTPQISIEARIVEANSSFKRQIGIQWGGHSLTGASGGNATGLNFPSTIGVTGANTDANTVSTGVASPSDFAVNIPAATGAGEGGALGLALGSIGGNFDINLRLSALEDTNSVRIISAPKVTVLNNVEAKISQGVSIPISVVSAAGTQTQFVQADLSLTVTPYVSQRDCAIAMKLLVTKNEPNFAQTGARGDPTILRKEAKTQMLVQDGETAVLGGIYTRNTGLQYKKIPWFGDLPVLGWLFKNRSENDDRTEVLVFITPKITNKASLRCQ